MRRYIPDNAKLVPENSERVFKGIIYDVYHWQQEMFDGSHKTFEMLKRPDTVKTLAVVDNEVVYIEQEQPGHELFFDLPGGRHDQADEDELACAQREMLEETGMSFRSWRLIDCFQPHTKIDQFMYIFLASELISTVEPTLDAGERIATKKTSFENFKTIAADNRSRYFPRDLIRSIDSLDQLRNKEALYDYSSAA